MISILITHYQRIEALKLCLESFRELDLQQVEYVVSDDGSDKIIQEQLKQLELDKLILSEQNCGLAANLNKGIEGCKGEYILYCQEDFIPKKELKVRLSEIIETLDSGNADMVRLKANYRFPKLINLSENIKLIPKFSWKNFYYNTFQYSDNPFVTNKSFFETYGKFLDNTSGSYGENEYAIRIMKSKAKIAIVNTYLFIGNQNSISVIEDPLVRKKRKTLKSLGLYKLLRAIRLHVEYICYNSKNRRLLTIKNKRVS